MTVILALLLKELFYDGILVFPMRDKYFSRNTFSIAVDNDVCFLASEII